MKTGASTNADAIAIAKEITLALIAKSPPKTGASPASKGEHAGKIFKAVLKQVIEGMKDCDMFEPSTLAELVKKGSEEEARNTRAGQNSDRTQ